MPDPKLNTQLTELAMNNPAEYVRQMKAAGREDELSPSDKLRGGIMGFFGGGSQQPPVAQPQAQAPSDNQGMSDEDIAAKKAALMRYRSQNS